MKNNLKIIALVILTFIAGMTTCRGGQVMLQLNFNECVENAAPATFGELIEAQAACMPSPILLKIFFW